MHCLLLRDRDVVHANPRVAEEHAREAHRDTIWCDCVRAVRTGHAPLVIPARRRGVRVQMTRERGEGHESSSSKGSISASSLLGAGTKCPTPTPVRHSHFCIVDAACTAQQHAAQLPVVVCLASTTVDVTQPAPRSSHMSSATSNSTKRGAASGPLGAPTAAAGAPGSGAAAGALGPPAAPLGTAAARYWASAAATQQVLAQRQQRGLQLHQLLSSTLTVQAGSPTASGASPTKPSSSVFKSDGGGGGGPGAATTSPAAGSATAAARSSRQQHAGPHSSTRASDNSAPGASAAEPPVVRPPPPPPRRLSGSAHSAASSASSGVRASAAAHASPGRARPKTGSVAGGQAASACEAEDEEELGGEEHEEEEEEEERLGDSSGTSGAEEEQQREGAEEAGETGALHAGGWGAGGSLQHGREEDEPGASPSGHTLLQQHVGLSRSGSGGRQAGSTPSWLQQHAGALDASSASSPGKQHAAPSSSSFSRHGRPPRAPLPALLTQSLSLGGAARRTHVTSVPMPPQFAVTNGASSSSALSEGVLAFWGGVKLQATQAPAQQQPVVAAPAQEAGGSRPGTASSYWSYYDLEEGALERLSTPAAGAAGKAGARPPHHHKVRCGCLCFNEPCFAAGCHSYASIHPPWIARRPNQQGAEEGAGAAAPPPAAPRPRPRPPPPPRRRYPARRGGPAARGRPRAGRRAAAALPAPAAGRPAAPARCLRGCLGLLGRREPGRRRGCARCTRPCSWTWRS